MSHHLSSLLFAQSADAGGAISFVADPAFPIWLIAGIAALLTGLTVWTYRGVPSAGPRRVGVILCLRLFAMTLALLTLARPSLALRDLQQLPALLLIVIDHSESMTIQDAYDNKSRWQAVQRALRQVEDQHVPGLANQNITVRMHAFAGSLREYGQDLQADGQRSDYAGALAALGELYGGERHLRGVLVVGDGANNGVRLIATSEAEKWRIRGGPVSTFVVGRTTTLPGQRDVVLTAIQPEPSPVPVKGKLTVRVLADAPGFEGQPMDFQLLIDGKKAGPVVRETARKSHNNEVRLAVDAPDRPGEIKVTVQVAPLPGEVTPINNEITTYVTVTKEGLSVLYVGGRLRPEQTFLARVLRRDPRIRLFEINRASDVPPTAAGDLYQFDKQHYDVIILGDLSARRLSAGDPAVLQRIHDLVSLKGTGFMMMGGFDTFGKDWAGTPIATLLPVELNAGGQVDRDVKMRPTDAGLRHFVLRLADNVDDNRAIWERLPALYGMNRLGTVKIGTRVLAEDAAAGAPVLVSQEYGKGRVLAFAGDTTHQWLRYEAETTRAGVALHARFWKQLALWLAQQDEATGSVWVRPETRRLPAGGKLSFDVGIRGKGGIDLDNGVFEVKVINPQGVEESVAVLKEGGSQRGSFWKTDEPGEYRIVVKGKATDLDGKTEISDEASVRFLVYQDTAELARQAADHDFMARLASAGGGQAKRLDELSQFLTELENQPQAQERPRLALYPDWRSSQLSPILPIILLLFILLLSLEWYLRRRWGLV